MYKRQVNSCADKYIVTFILGISANGLLSVSYLSLIHIFYVTITYVARLALKSFLKKKGFGASRKSLFVIAPDAMLRNTLRTVEKSCILTLLKYFIKG